MKQQKNEAATTPSTRQRLRRWARLGRFRVGLVWPVFDNFRWCRPISSPDDYKDSEVCKVCALYEAWTGDGGKRSVKDRVPGGFDNIEGECVPASDKDNRDQSSVEPAALDVLGGCSSRDESDSDQNDCCQLEYDLEDDDEVVESSDNDDIEDGVRILFSNTLTQNNESANGYVCVQRQNPFYENIALVKSNVDNRVGYKNDKNSHKGNGVSHEHNNYTNEEPQDNNNLEKGGAEDDFDDSSMQHARHAHHASKAHHTRSHQHHSRNRHAHHHHMHHRHQHMHGGAGGHHHRAAYDQRGDGGGGAGGHGGGGGGHGGGHIGGGGEDDHEPGKFEEITGIAIQGEGLDSVLGSFATYARLKGRYDDDWIDRLNHLYTTIILIIFTIVVSTKQYVGEPIHCWCPAQFEESHVDYTNNVCWVSNTFFVHFKDDPPRDWKLPYESEIQYYQWVPMILLFQALLFKVAYTNNVCWVANTFYVPFDDTLPRGPQRPVKAEIEYYQWVPMILLFMALMFKVPCILWRILTASAGVNLDKIVTLAAETAYVAPDDRDRTIKHIVRYMDRWIENAREYRSGCFIRLRQQISKYCCIVWGKRYGNYLVTLYMFIKLLYLGNAIGQLFILNEFLGTNFNVYGFEVMDHLARGESWSESPRFPRITHCFFKIRQLSNVHDYTVQCVLPINLFNEKIFIFIWFWLVFVATLSSFNFLIWIYTMIFRQHRLRYLKKFLRINDCYKSELDKKMAVKFCEQYLRQDGIFVLRLVGKNANDVLVSELILQLWNHYRNKPLFRHANQISDDNSNV
ncbi:innexin [Plakobranchus ocellatus]|uniref:Innexin n=2 Tax=Panpulmonata TaxID=977775 RepID=A0AAV3Z4G5_9GAST|nr:innexin [Plakobranchus ocellatus]